MIERLVSYFGFSFLCVQTSTFQSNRIQQELGVSMLLLWGLFATKAYTAYLAYQIVPGAGIALACTLSWLGAAASLGSATWRLNPDPNTGKNQSLVPRKVVPKYP